MNTVTGIVLSRKSGKSVLINKTAVSELNINIGDGEWNIGLDPASKFTGIALMDRAEKYVILLDVKRDERAPKDRYFDDLYYLLKRLVHNKEIKLVVNEKPFVKGFPRASDVLIALRGRIEEWRYKIPELSTAEYKMIYPQSWKSQIINKAKGKDRFNAKGAVAEDLIDEFPGLQQYLSILSSGDLDSFDALGILLGYLRKTYTEDGIERISGMMEGSHNSFVGYEWVQNDDLDEQYINRVFGVFSQIFQPKYLMYNESYGLNENIKLASSNYDCVFTLVPPKMLQQFQWKFGIDISEPDHQLVMFIFRKGHFTPKEMLWAQQKFTMNEEVGAL